MALAVVVLSLAAPTHIAVHEHPPIGCNSVACERRVHARQVARQRRLARHLRYRIRVHHRDQWRRMTAPYRDWLRSTRMCESGGDYRINTGNGFYGAYQFTLESWYTVGGRGLPNDAEPLEQDYRAIRLLHIQGVGAWPVCGH